MNHTQQPSQGTGNFDQNPNDTTDVMDLIMDSIQESN